MNDLEVLLAAFVEATEVKCARYGSPTWALQRDAEELLRQRGWVRNGIDGSLMHVQEER